MNDSPFFSIITPAYNRAEFLPAAVNSVLNQTFTDFEYIIIDDASTDNSKEIIESFDDSRLVFLRNERNMERGASRNRGLAVAKGKYVCLLDSDDEFLENHLEVLYKNIVERNEPVALLFTKSYQRFGDKPIGKRDYEPIENHNIFKYILKYTFNCDCVTIHSNILNDFQFDPEIPGLEDIDLWLHIALKYPIISIVEYTNILNFHQGSYTIGDYYRFEKELRNFRRIFSKIELRKILPLSAKKRLLAMCHYHLAVRYEKENKIASMYWSVLNSFFCYPGGYNKCSNKSMLVMALYHIPLFGLGIKFIARKLK